jgi:protein-S-isoprenylcysteine O-methyltransferase Ste14
MAGWPFVITGALLAAWSVRSAGPDDIADPPRLIVAGPYRLTRNPMYLAWTSLTLGIGLVRNNAWIVAGVIPAWLFLNFVTIPREKRTLGVRFGQAYTEYAAMVRRWL